MAINVAKIQAELDLDSGRFSGQITSAIGQIKGFNSVVNNTDKSIKNIERRVTGFGASVRDAMVVLGQFRASMQTLWAGTGQWVMEIIKANAELERMQALLRGVAKGDAGQRNAQANADLAYTIELAQKAPFSISAIGDSIVKLRSAGLDATTTMQGLTDAVAAFGGNDETLKRATVALQQMAGKGVVSMEELRQQLGEAVPTAMKLMARGLGVSMANLTKQVSTGTVEAVSAIKAMNLEMQREYAGSGQAMMKTWVGMTAKLKTEWMLFAKEIGDGGLFDAAKTALKQLSDIMKDQNTINGAIKLGQAIADLIKTISSGVSWIIENQNAIVAWGKAIATVVAGGYIISMIRNLTFLKAAMLAMQATITTATGANAGFIKSFAGMGVMGQMRTLASGLGGALNSLLLTFTGFSGPVGIAIAAIGALIGWMVKLRVEANQTREAVARALEMKASDFMSADDKKKVEGQIEAYDKLQNRLNNERSKLTWNPESQRQAMMSIASELGDKAMYDRLIGMNQQELGRMFNVIGGEIAKKKSELQATITRSDRNFLIFNQNKFVDGNTEVIQESIAKVAGVYQRQEAELEKRALATNMSQEKINEERNRILLAEQADQVKVYDSALVTLRASHDSQTAEQQAFTGKLIAELEKRRTAVVANTNDILAARKQGIVTMTEPAKDKAAAKQAAADADKLQDLYARTAARSEQLKAQLNDGIPKLAKFKEMILQGQYGKANPALVAAIEELINANDQLEKDIAKSKATDKLVSDLDEMEAKAKADVISQSLKSSGDVYSQVAAGMVGFNRQVAVMRAGLDKTSMSAADFEEKVKGIQTELFKVDMMRFADFVTETNMENNNATLSDRVLRIAEYNEKLRQFGILRAQLLAGAGSDEQKDEINRGVDSLIASETNRFQYESANAWGKYMQQYQDMTQSMNDIWGNALDDMTDRMTTMFTTGKFGWKDFLKTILSEITKLMLAKAVIGFVNMFAGMWGGGGGSYTGNGTGAGSMAGFGNNMANFTTKSANGNIMTDEGPLQLKKYDNGGIARTPQLSLFGEGRLPEAYVPLPDGRSIPVTMDGSTGGGGVQNNVSINISMGEGGSEVTQGDNTQSRELGKALSVAVKQELANQMQPGGILWKQRNGGR